MIESIDGRSLLYGSADAPLAIEYKYVALLRKHIKSVVRNVLV